jgi:hypothetical protein
MMYKRYYTLVIVELTMNRNERKQVVVECECKGVAKQGVKGSIGQCALLGLKGDEWNDSDIVCIYQGVAKVFRGGLW